MAILPTARAQVLVGSSAPARAPSVPGVALGQGFKIGDGAGQPAELPHPAVNNDCDYGPHCQVVASLDIAWHEASPLMWPRQHRYQKIIKPFEPLAVG